MIMGKEKSQLSHAMCPLTYPILTGSQKQCGLLKEPFCGYQKTDTREGWQSGNECSSVMLSRSYYTID